MLEKLKQLIVIDEYKTLSKASEILNLSQPALTRSMQKLEEELGVTLFERKKNRIILNDNGELAIKYAKKLLKDVEDMKINIHYYDQSKRIISIGSIAPMPIIGLKHIFSKIYPNKPIKETINANQKDLLEGLNNNDYSLIVLDHPIKNKDYINLYFFREELYLSVPTNHEFSSLKQITFNDLNGKSVLLRGNLGYWQDLKEKRIPNSTLIFEDNETILNELIQSSTLPGFRTNISNLRVNQKENRIYIPFLDDEAKVDFYIIYKKTNKQLFYFLKNAIKELDWKKT